MSSGFCGSIAGVPFDCTNSPSFVTKIPSILLKWNSKSSVASDPGFGISTADEPAFV